MSLLEKDAKAVFEEGGKDTLADNKNLFEKLADNAMKMNEKVDNSKITNKLAVPKTSMEIDMGPDTVHKISP
jgi:hypothetical protein